MKQANSLRKFTEAQVVGLSFRDFVPVPVFPARTELHPEHCRYYHIIGRCVPRAYLCGFDKASGRNYEHRRQRLADLSWFLMALNEHIVRLANAEDRCTEAFWEGGFKSQALLDEKALACMAYVDLNPIRAAMARAPETSLYTWIRQRINGCA